MSIRTMTEDDWPQVWPFFDQIVQAGETYAYPLGLTSEQAQALWTMSPPGQTVVPETTPGLVSECCNEVRCPPTTRL